MILLAAIFRPQAQDDRPMRICGKRDFDLAEPSRQVVGIHGYAG